MNADIFDNKRNYTLSSNIFLQITCVYFENSLCKQTSQGVVQKHFNVKDIYIAQEALMDQSVVFQSCLLRPRRGNKSGIFCVRAWNGKNLQG